MIPVLFKIGPLEVGSFGVMMLLGFLVPGLLLKNELQRRGYPGEWAWDLIVWAAIGGIIGARLYFILEHVPDFLNDPLGMLFSRGGLSWFGGFVLGAGAVLYKLKKLPAPTVEILDALAPLLLLGYAIGRIGCLLAGDGDYGPPTDLPWGMAFPNGVVPTDVPVHPTPLYETIMAGGLFFALWSRRHRLVFRGEMLSLTLIAFGAERFIAEFWRLTPKFWGWMTVPQFFSLVTIAVGIIAFREFKHRNVPQTQNTKGQP